MTSKVAKLQRASLDDPVKVQVNEKYSTVESLCQYYLFIPAKNKDTFLAHLLLQDDGLGARRSILVFTDTCNQTQRLAYILHHLSLDPVPIHGQLTQEKRLAALTQFKEGRKSILIATDVASRGLDIPSVDVVINYDIPMHSKDYIHRVGRTARAGRSGKSITMVTQYDIELYQRIEQVVGKKLPEYPLADKGAVMRLHERVLDAQRFATLQLKDDKERRSLAAQKGNNKRAKMAAE
jgi:ATP-dependent RNA helicase DDX47/RRP3